MSGKVVDMNLSGFGVLAPTPSKLRRDALIQSRKGNEAARKAREANSSARDKRRQAEDAKVQQELRKLEEEVAKLEQEVLEYEEAVGEAYQGVAEAEAALLSAKAEHADTIDTAKTLANALKRNRELLDEYRKRV